MSDRTRVGELLQGDLADDVALDAAFLAFKMAEGEIATFVKGPPSLDPVAVAAAAADPRIGVLKDALGVADHADLVRRARRLGAARPELVTANDLRELIVREASAGRELAFQAAPPTETWWNYTGRTEALARAILRPGSIRELVRQLEQLPAGRKVRVVGGGHADNAIAEATDVRIELTGLDDVALFDGHPDPGSLRPAWLRKGLGGRPLARVSAGTRVADVNRRLDEAGLGLINMGSYDRQAIFGAITTGTHGSGAGLGSLASAVRSIDVLTLRDLNGATVVRKLRVEERDGPTDPVAFAAGPGLAGWELVQDDSRFRALVVSFGHMGVVVAVTLEVRTRYWLREQREMSMLRRELDGLEGKLADWRHYEILVNPYPEDSGDQRVVVTRRTVDNAQSGPVDPRRDPAPLRALREAGPSRAAACARGQDAGGQRSRLSLALRVTADQELPFSVSHQVLMLGAGNYVTARSSEVFVPVADLKPALARLRQITAEHATRGILHTSPLGVRFVRGGSAWLAPSRGPGVLASIEIPMLLTSPGDHELVDTAARELGVMGARPHWGQHHALTLDDVHRLYGAEALEHWVSALREFDPDGRCDNAHTAGLQLRSVPAAAVGAGLAIAGASVSADSDRDAIEEQELEAMLRSLAADPADRETVLAAWAMVDAADPEVVARVVTRLSDRGPVLVAAAAAQAQPVLVQTERPAPSAPSGVPSILEPGPGKNWGQNLSLGNTAVLAVSRARVWRALEDARSAGKTVHPVGTTHSSSWIVQSRGRLLDTGILEATTPSGPDDEFRQVTTLNPEWYDLDEAARRSHVGVGAGVRVAELMAALDRLPFPAAPQMIGAYTGQTFVGALCTGTHGSGVAHGPVHTCVRSIQLMATDPATGAVTEYRIERTQGITDRARYGAANPTVRLRQDDDLFQAALVSLGCLGVVTSVIIEVKPAYMLQRSQHRTDWDEVRGLLLDVDGDGWPTAFVGRYSAGILMNPYPQPLKSQQSRTAVVHQEFIPAHPPIDAEAPTATDVPGVLFELARGMANIGLAPTAIELALERLAKTTSEYGHSHQILGSSGDLPRGWSVEYALPLQGFVPVLDEILAKMLRLAIEDRRFVCGTLAIRFVARDDAHLSMTQGRHSVFLEFLSLSRLEDAQHVFQAIEAIALAAGARPHWGQWWNPASLPGIAASYPGVQRFRAAMRELNGTGLFDNAFAQHLRKLGP